MNKADNEAGNAAIDSLLNYETVKVNFCPHTHTSSSIYLFIYPLSPFPLSSLPFIPADDFDLNKY